ncbi:MAG: hypothetical protein J07HQX50_02816 [Haloquadratum sp. J07HQX50]|nr:MAG: hypothetical protein J07HQX50_02816 [Haloquadratum sp. J07HQX50]
MITCEPTFRVATLLTRVRWLHYIHENLVIFGLVHGELLYRVERPLLELTGVQDAFADVLQVPERNRRTVVTAGFLHDGLRDTVEVVFTPPSECQFTGGDLAAVCTRRMCG